jgi:hypothetical protein
MMAGEVIDRVAREQGWSEDKQIDLLCRFIDSLDTVTTLDGIEHPEPSAQLATWLFNTIKWEKTQ